MGLIERIFKGGKDKGSEPAGQATTQFYETDPETGDSQGQRAAPRRELVQVVLRDTMRKHGIPSDWIECRIMSAVTRSGRRGMHVNFVVRQAHEQMLPYVFAFQDSFERELARFEPRCRDWLMSLGWEFTGCTVPEEAEAGSWSPAGRAPEPAAAVPAAPHERAQAEGPKTDEEVQRDLEALFAIRDAALADAARPRDPQQPDFEPTQPVDDREPPRR